jgi:hypothetical protein
MHKFGLVMIFGLVACGGGVEGVRVGSSTASNVRSDRGDLNGKSAPEEGDVGIGALPFPIEPLDAAASSAEVDRLTKIAWVESNWVPPGQSDRWGHAQMLVNAPLDDVRARVVDFGHLKDLAPQKFKTSRIVDKHGPLTDVYLQFPMMKGLVMLWQVVRFAPPEVIAPGHEVVQGAMVKGNVKQLRIVVGMRSVDAARTVVTCDLVMIPEFYAPQASIDEELRDAAHDAVAGVKEKVERR